MDGSSRVSDGCGLGRCRSSHTAGKTATADPFSRVREKVAAKQPDEGVVISTPLTTTLVWGSLCQEEKCVLVEAARVRASFGAFCALRRCRRIGRGKRRAERAPMAP